MDKGLLTKRVTENNDALESLGTDWIGCTPLMLAANFGRFSIVKALLEKGADPESTNANVHAKKSMTARDYAIQSGHEAVAVLLDEHIFNMAVNTGNKAVLEKKRNRSSIRASIRDSVALSDASSSGGGAIQNIW